MEPNLQSPVQRASSSGRKDRRGKKRGEIIRTNSELLWISERLGGLARKTSGPWEPWERECAAEPFKPEEGAQVWPCHFSLWSAGRQEKQGSLCF